MGWFNISWKLMNTFNTFYTQMQYGFRFQDTRCAEGMEATQRPPYTHTHTTVQHYSNLIPLVALDLVWNDSA